MNNYQIKKEPELKPSIKPYQTREHSVESFIRAGLYDDATLSKSLDPAELADAFRRAVDMAIDYDHARIGPNSLNEQKDD